MSISSDKPNFRIIEGNVPQIDYEEFKKDFLDVTMLAPAIKKKYNMTKSQWRDYRQRVLDETGLTEKPHRNHRMGIEPNINSPFNHLTGMCYNARYIQKRNNGYIIVKKIKGKAKYFGRYDDYDTAEMVRDKLLESNWDDALGIILKEKYGVGRHNMGYAKAVKLFDEFEDKYFNSDERIVDIVSEMGISQRVYKFLLEMIREKHGRDTHRSRRDSI